jgi:hypothetical protein
VEEKNAGGGELDARERRSRGKRDGKGGRKGTTPKSKQTDQSVRLLARETRRGFLRRLVPWTNRAERNNKQKTQSKKATAQGGRKKKRRGFLVPAAMEEGNQKGGRKKNKQICDFTGSKKTQS